MDTDIRTSSINTFIPATTGMDVDIMSKFKLNRYLGDVLTLPYDFNNIKIKSNELCIADNINASLYKLHYNFLFLNAITKLADNDFPKQYNGFVTSNSASSAYSVDWYGTGTDTISSHLGSTSTILSGIVTGAFTQSTTDKNVYVGVVATSGRLIGYQGILNGNVPITFNLNKNTIEDASKLVFTNIKTVLFNTQKHLVVLDGNDIHKFNVDAILTTNRAISSIGRFLIKTIGGKSKSVYDKDKFNSPVCITIGDGDSVYMLDGGDGCIKTYDKDLNWTNTSIKWRDFNSVVGGVVSIDIDRETSDVYVLGADGTILRYDKDIILIERILSHDILGAGETYKQILFSPADKEIVYVLTTKNIFKRFKTKLTKSIGTFRLSENKIRNQDFTFINILYREGSPIDVVYVGGNSTHATVIGSIGKIFRFDEQLTYKTTIYDNFRDNIFSIESININSKEFVSSWVFNKSISKILSNHILLRNNVLFKYEGQYDRFGRVQYITTRYLRSADFNLNSYAPTLNNYVGINEPMFADTVNRPLKELYILQSQLLDMCRETIINKYPQPGQVVELK